MCDAVLLLVLALARMHRATNGAQTVSMHPEEEKYLGVGLSRRQYRLGSRVWIQDILHTRCGVPLHPGGQHIWFLGLVAV